VHFSAQSFQPLFLFLTAQKTGALKVESNCGLSRRRLVEGGSPRGGVGSFTRWHPWFYPVLPAPHPMRDRLRRASSSSKAAWIPAFEAESSFVISRRTVPAGDPKFSYITRFFWIPDLVMPGIARPE